MYPRLDRYGYCGQSQCYRISKRAGGTRVGYVFKARLTGSCLWYASFSLTISPVGYMGLSETATVTLRAKTAAVGTMFCQGMSFAYNNIVPICLNAPALGTGGTG